MEIETTNKKLKTENWNWRLKTKNWKLKTKNYKLKPTKTKILHSEDTTTMAILKCNIQYTCQSSDWQDIN